jgi:hypothetical protein
MLTPSVRKASLLYFSMTPRTVAERCLNAHFTTTLQSRLSSCDKTEAEGRKARLDDTRKEPFSECEGGAGE